MRQAALKAANKAINKKEAGMAFGSKVFGSKKAYVFDTSALMEYPQVLRVVKRHRIILPRIVMTELDGLKNNERQDVAARARLVSRYLEKYGKNVAIATDKQMDRLQVLDSAGDNMVIGTATWMKRQGIDTTLVTADRNMRIVARACGIMNRIPRPWYRQPALYWSIIAIPFIALGFLVANAVSHIWTVNGFLTKETEPYVGIGSALALPTVFVAGLVMNWVCDVLPDEATEDVKTDDKMLNNMVFNPVLSGFETNVWHSKKS